MQFRMETKGNTGYIYIDDVIGDSIFGGTSAKQFREDLAELGDVGNIVLQINSPGGDIIDGFAIYNALVEHSAKVHAKINGWAASMASIIAMSGDTVEMPSNAWFMIHNPMTIAIGESEDLRQVAEVMESMKNHGIRAYQRHIDVDEQTISDWMDAETWMSGEDAEGLGWKFQFTDPLKVAASVTPFFNEEKVPEDAKQWLNRAQNVQPDNAGGENDDPEPTDNEPKTPSDSGNEPQLSEAEMQVFNRGYEAGRIAGNQEKQGEVDNLTSQVETLNGQIKEKTAEVDKAEREKQGLSDQLAQLLPGTDAPPLDGGVKTWDDALTECEGDYAEARRRYPEIYKQKRENDKQTRNQ